MILVIGGSGSGKREYVKSLNIPESDIQYDLHELVFGGEAPTLEELLKKKIVVCDEVGSGVIPLDKDERLKREATGRLCCKLAEQAERVIRMVAGIPIIIKQ